MEWLKQISKAIDYIENNLTSDISYDEAAKIACCSTYYFQRMFSYFFTSTALFSMNNISGSLKIAVIINPFTHVINCIRSLILGSTIEWQYLLFVIGVFILLCCGSFALAIQRLKREMIK